MTAPKGYLNARQAAIYVGYEPGAGPRRTDKAMRAFYAFVRRHKVQTKRRGRSLLFRERDLDRAIDACTDAEQRERFDRMASLAREYARGTARSA